MCCKRRYPSKRSAIEANRTAGFRLRAYTCSDCSGYWHVTNADKSGAPIFQEPRRSSRRRTPLASKLAPARTLAELEEIARQKRAPFR